MFRKTCRLVNDSKGAIAIFLSAATLLIGGGRAFGRIEARLSVLESGQQEIRGLLLGHIQGYNMPATKVAVPESGPHLITTAYAQEVADAETTQVAPKAHPVR